MGGEVTGKADLYSLGAMLYELVTGRPPFLGDDSVAIIGQHINTPPVAPTWHRSDCPRPLEALIQPDEFGDNLLHRETLPRDPWGNVYLYDPPSDGQEYRIYTYGADGEQGGEGDNRDFDNRMGLGG